MHNKFIVGFSRPRKFKIGAYLIAWWANKPYSHTFIRHTDTQGRDLIFHAAHGTVHQILTENFLLNNQIVKEVQMSCNESQYQRLRDICYAKCGLLYSTKQILLMPIHDLAKSVLGVNMKTEDDSGYICSELVAYVLSEIKGMKFNKPFNYLRPDDIDNKLAK